jgi:protein ImuA
MNTAASFSIRNKRLIADLRDRIERLEGAGGAGDAAGRASLGIEAIDRALSGGLGRPGLHEILAGDDSGAAAGFCAFLLARLGEDGGAVLWARQGAGLYGPGLAALGLDPARLILVRPARGDDVLWVLEEGLRSKAPAAVLGETGSGGPIALRRLQLAAESSGVAALLLRPFAAKTMPGPALSRWRIESAGGGDLRGPRWRVELQRSRGGTPGTWLVEWCDETSGFAVAPELRHRPARPSAPAASLSAAL